MRIVEKDICYLIDDFFDKGVCAGYTKNILPGNLPADAEKILLSLDTAADTAYMKQIHTAVIHRIDKAGCYEGDGLFTGKKKLLLAVRTADCLPLIFSSQKLGIAGVVHMGWKPAKEGILENIPYDLESFKVFAGVGMRKDCYEVGKEFFDYPEFVKHLSRDGRGIRFDPIGFAKEYLFAKGLKKENFLDADICSICKKDLFFSNRKDKTDGRTVSFIFRED
jgi:copper oxidase (laccase) domain-containing protein